jgi:hypothetical protein
MRENSPFDDPAFDLPIPELPAPPPLPRVPRLSMDRLRECARTRGRIAAAWMVTRWGIDIVVHFLALAVIVPLTWVIRLLFAAWSIPRRIRHRMLTRRWRRAYRRRSSPAV